MTSSLKNVEFCDWINVNPMIVARINVSPHKPTDNLFITILRNQGENNAVKDTAKYITK